MFCWDHPIYASFPLSCFGCSVVWIAHVKLDLSLRWSLALTCWHLLGLRLFWSERSLPLFFFFFFFGGVGGGGGWGGGENCWRFFSIELFTEAFPFGFFFLPCYLLELFSFVSATALSFLSGFGRVLPFCQFLAGAPFIVQAFSVPLSHHGGCFLLFREPLVLCVGLRLRSFVAMSESDLS